MTVYLMKNLPVYWECIDDSSAKFWAAKILKKKGGKFVLVRKWGKIDTKGQSMKTEFNDIHAAEQELEKLVWGKEKKGYKPVF